MSLPHWAGHHTRRRRFIQVAFLSLFVLLPLFDLLRFDFTRQRLHLFGQEIWLDEWTLLWLFLMFSMWVIGAVSLVFGRVYCAYACPQMVFTELAHDLDAFGLRVARRFDPKRRARVARAVSLGLLALVSVAASVVLMGYFAPLDDVLRRLARFDLGPWVGAIGAIAAALAFLDFAFVRETFCRAACPYGLLQGVIEDGRSLHVHLDVAKGECIDCGACARVCPMGIDIRDGAFQIECTRCGSCIDACDGVLARLKAPRPGLLGFAFGGSGLARWDAKRVLVAVATVGFGVALVLAVALRERVSLHLSPLYDTADARPSELAESRFLLRVANRGRESVLLGVDTDGLPAESAILGLDDPQVAAGEERKFTLVVRVPRTQVHSSVTPFTWVVRAGERSERFPAALFARKGKTG